MLKNVSEILDSLPSDKKMKVTYNSKGEVIQPEDELIKKLTRENECVNTIQFCCIGTVPDGFILETPFDLTLTSACFDLSALSCCLENRTATGMVPNPCDGVLECPTEIQAVRLVGCARMTANGGPVRPIKPPFTPGSSCTVNCSTTTCVDQVIDFTCGKTPPCEPCFEVQQIIVVFGVITDDCGRQAFLVTAQLVVEFIGCDDC